MHNPDYVPDSNLADISQSPAAMSGQLCFLTRYGPFSESLDDEVTFQTPTDGDSDEISINQATDNLATESDLLIDQDNVNEMERCVTHNNSVPKTFIMRMGPNESSSDSSEGSSSFSSQESLAEIVVPLGQPWLTIGRFFNNTIISIIILLLVAAVSLTLAGVGVFVVRPMPYFDKSLDAFQIPNHISTLRHLAFEAALKDNFKDLRKRSLDSFGNLNSKDDTIFALPSHKYNSEFPGLGRKNHNIGCTQTKQKNIEPLQSNRLISEDTANGRTFQRLRRGVPHIYRPMKWRILLVYMAQGDDLNIFTRDRLETIHKVEMAIMRHSNFTDFCARNSKSYSDAALASIKYCSPLNSLLTYFYPSVVSGKVIYDGMGSNLADINGTLSHAMTQPTFYWYVDTDMTMTNHRSKFLRSEVWFGPPFGEEMKPLSEEETARIYNEYLITYIDLLDKASTDKVRVLYGGTQLFDYEVAETIAHDLRLAIPTGIAILSLLFVLTSFSFWLTLWGFASILLSFAWAYFIYHVAFAKIALGLLNVVSGFVIIGIGVDDVFVFVNTFMQAERFKDPVQRMAHTLKTAGIATFFTSFTTAGAFAANIASQIPAINDFGLFMCLIVSFCWVLVVLVMPCALTLWQRCFHCETFLCRRCKGRSNDPVAAMATLARVLDHHERQATSSLSQHQTPDEVMAMRDANASPRRGSQDGDIPMLDLEEDANIQRLLEDDDVPLILTNDDNYPLVPASSSTPSRATSTQTHPSLTRSLQVFLYRYVARPVIKGRWIVILLYFMLFVISLILVIHIKPAARPPALYNEGTNLQQLLDLAYNFSGKDISCKSCSGFGSDGGIPGGWIPGSGPVTLPPVALPTTKMITGSSQDTLPKSQRPHVESGTEQPQVGTESNDIHAATAEMVPVATHQPDHGYPTPFPIHPTNPPPTQHLQLATTARPPPEPTALTCDNRDFTCKFGSSCVDQDPLRGPVCRCMFHCIQSVNWVCGSDGRNYKNACLLKKASCQEQRIIDLVYQGRCFDPHTSSSGHNGGQNGGHSHTVKPGGGGPPGGGGVPPGGSNSSSAGSGFNPCGGGSCGKPAKRPVLDNLALVYVVFGIERFDRNKASQEHVIEDTKGKVIYNPKFELMNEKTLRALCKICKNIAARTDLVTPGGAQCFPSGVADYVKLLKLKYAECRGTPEPSTKSRSLLRKKGNKVVWFAMAFQSKTFMGKSSFTAYKDYNAWETAIQEEKDALPQSEKAGLGTMFQTCSFWKQIFMEIVGVTSAIYGVAFSLLVCVIGIVIFTAHIGILFIAFLTIGGVIMVVVSMFYLLGWEMGAVEAVSLSIIVGSSIDYCIHLIEGYLVAGDRVPDITNKSAAQVRRWRTRHSMGTIGVSILSSAFTTIIASVPLCFTTIHVFAKFGKIVALNTFVSIVYTLTACAAFLSIAGPARYRWSLRWFLFSSLILGILIGAIVMTLFVMHKGGVSIPGPSGNPLF